LNYLLESRDLVPKWLKVEASVLVGGYFNVKQQRAMITD
jgi:hypothetical protein